ncbi:choice-of-anchor B family protein [Neolewinella lacunae]|nr:choice-of-anchor B family protein [Neolewinella lacunae]
MMQRFLLLALLAYSSLLTAQLNTTLRANLPYNDGVNDVWGYAAPDGTEYAIVGLVNGVSFVSLADPDNPVEVARIAGARSQWRDMKTFGEYAYSVADQGAEGITAFDLRFLPDSVPFRRTQYDIPGFPRTFVRAHNLYIDTEIGRIYTAGGDRNINDGGIFMFDLVANPMIPTLVGMGPQIYSHDVYVKNDTMYCSEIYLGRLAIYDVADLADVELLGSTLTPFTFTHNAWTTDDAQLVFTTDEEPNAPVAAYDISNKDDIELLDEYRPAGTLNRGTIPHNVHVIDEYLSISYYTDGLRVVDASVPDNLVEVANYDTWLGADGDFNGAWGAYPFLPSGLTLVSDRQTGLYVVDVNYLRAARLKGTIVDRDLRTPINNVNVSIASTQPNVEATDALGRYKTGLGTAGTYQVTFSVENYLPLTVTVNLENGVETILDTALQTTVPRFDIDVTVIDDATEAVIPNATFRFFNEELNVERLADANGKVEVPAIFDGEYTLYVAEWGYQTEARTAISSQDLQGVTIRLKRGYMDDFVTDEGWSATGDATSGQWVRDIPIATVNENLIFAPGTDAPGDLGEEAYITGNGGGSAGTDDVDNGTVILTSPTFRPLAGQDTLVVHYQYYFANGGGTGTPLDDTLVIRITNGRDTVVARRHAEDGRVWTQDSFRINDFMDLSDELRVIVSTSDFNTSGHLVEAGFDNFLVTGNNLPTSTEYFGREDLDLTLFPNPSAAAFALRYDLGSARATQLRVRDALGRQVLARNIEGSQGTVRFGAELPAGLYFVEVMTNNARLWVGKAIKSAE